MTGRRAFTLVETLAAAAILAVMAAACAPLLAQAMRAADDPAEQAPGDWDALDLGRLADRIAEDPAAFGIDPTGPVDALVGWPEATGRPAVHVSRLDAEGEDGTEDGGSTGAWLAMRCDGRIAVRWVAPEAIVPPKEGAP